MQWLFSQNGFVHVCGHRGHSVAAPENTRAALRANRLLGGTTAEIDTVLTCDGEIVVIHDLTLDRTTNGTGAVADFTLDELQRLDAGSWFSPDHAGERILTLTEAITFARQIGLGLEVEVKEKRDLAGYGRALARALADPSDLAQVMMISFDHAHLHDLKQAIPGLVTGGICGARYADPVGLARAATLDEVCIDLSAFHPDDAAALHDAGIAIRCHAYNPAEMAEAQRAGLAWQDDLQRWLAGGLIDTLSGDDVAWCAAMVAKAMAGRTEQ